MLGEVITSVLERRRMDSVRLGQDGDSRPVPELDAARREGCPETTGGDHLIQ